MTCRTLSRRNISRASEYGIAYSNSARIGRQGKFEEGIAAAEAVITENPGEPWAYKEVGFSALYLGNPLGALDWFAKADRLGPRDPARWTWLDGQGHALILLGRDEEAVRSLRAALDSNPNTVGSYAWPTRLRVTSTSRVWRSRSIKGTIPTSRSAAFGVSRQCR